MSDRKIELQEAKRQLESLLNKTTSVLNTFEIKKTGNYKSQITLSKRRIKAYQISIQLIEDELRKLEK